jgi:DNA-directed RNA polymerase specialized sigma24 family protein
MTVTISNQRIDTFFSEARRPETLEQMRQLMKWIDHLPRKDQTLLKLVVQVKLTRGEVARALGVPRGTITRRLQRLARRLYNPLAMALLDESCDLSDEQRRVAIAVLITNEPMNKLAARLRRPVREVKDIVTFVRGWHRGAVLRIHRHAMLGRGKISGTRAARATAKPEPAAVSG